MAAPGAPTGDAEAIREIHWVSFASAASPEEVASFYGARGMHLDGERTYRAGRLVLSVHPASDAQHPTCSEKPKPAERTLIVVSQARP